ncbi:UNVERIFIED_CONTAM: hypothetical protein RMT77_017014 [Armadillidium vulgare]
MHRESIVKKGRMKMSKILFFFIFIWLMLANEGNVEAFKRRRISFARCYEDVTMPKALFMDCANVQGTGDCEVRKGSTHILRALFRPKKNARVLDSYVVWENSWVPVPLPNQIREACNSSLACPLTKNKLSMFSYDLPIDDFWPQGDYPVQWTLTDMDTEEEILCFKFKVLIV